MSTIRVRHGSLEVNVPVSVFFRGTAEFNETASEYFSMLRRRYPWLTPDSLAVLRRTAQREMQRIIDERLRGPRKAKMLSAEGKDMQAVQHLESYLVERPDDADAWYALGDILCKMGRNEEGYKAINHGRRLSGSL
ncbi:MAG: tetratricopeptide repeat protein [Methanomassiliicoccaceae archaeon]|nr:tetratricopeptide repeat protein [Methanomassiliicoccaceae archaeon]